MWVNQCFSQTLIDGNEVLVLMVGNDKSGCASVFGSLSLSLVDICKVGNTLQISTEETVRLGETRFSHCPISVAMRLLY